MQLNRAALACTALALLACSTAAAAAPADRAGASSRRALHQHKQHAGAASGPGRKLKAIFTPTTAS